MVGIEKYTQKFTNNFSGKKYFPFLDLNKIFLCFIRKQNYLFFNILRIEEYKSNS